jgi:spore maturation protein CgeB
MRILFCGELSARWRSGWQRCQSLKDLGHQVIEFHHERYSDNPSLVQKLTRRVTGKAFGQEVLSLYNRDFVETLQTVKPQIAWIEWPQMLLADTVRDAKRQMSECIFVSFQDDNPFGSRRNERPRWRYFLEAIPKYDLHFVKRECDLTEFRNRGAQRVELFMHGFYPAIFHPVPEGSIPAGYRHDVSFVGTPHDHRVEVITKLMLKYRFSIHVYGGKWNRTLIHYRRKNYFHACVFSEDYVSVLCGSKICLGFVSSSNEDEYTMRTFEIPACKGFFLAERTPAHQTLFVEGKEAEFFSTAEECADKITYYLANESARKKIAEAGYQRCIDSNYSLQRRLSDALRVLERLAR